MFKRIIMTTHLHSEALLPSIFTTTVKAFKSGANAIADNLLMNLIFELQKNNKEMLETLKEIEKEPRKAVEIDTDMFHDSMLYAQDNSKKLLKLTKQNKDNSDIFNEVHKITETVYQTSMTLSINVTTTASEVRYQDRQLAS